MASATSDPSSGSASVVSVVEMDDMLREVLSRLDDVKTMVVAAMVSKPWLSTVSAREFANEFKRRYSPPLIGFIAVYSRPVNNNVRFTAMPDLVGDLKDKAASVAALLAAFDRPMHSDPVVCCRNGDVVVRKETRVPRYVKRAILGAGDSLRIDPPELVAPAWGGNPEKATSVFIVVGRELAFFDKLQEAAPSASSGVHVVVNIFHQGSRQLIPSPTLASRYPGLLLERPYAFISENIVFMLYVHGEVIALDLESGSFSIIPLPPVFECLTDSELKVARCGKSGLCVLRAIGHELQYWELGNAFDGSTWSMIRSFNLRVEFDLKIGAPFWDKLLRGPPFHMGDTYFCSVRIHAAGDNGRSAVIGFGFSRWIFHLDLAALRATRVISSVDQHSPSAIFPVTLPWPTFKQSE